MQDLAGTISRLVEDSQVERPVEAGPARFALLETIREYGLEQLEAAGELAQMARRHAELYASLVEQAEPQLTGPRHIEWLDRLAGEQLNLRAALAWAKRNDIDLGLTMAGRMWRFWQLSGGLTEGRRWLEDLLQVAGVEPSVPRAKALRPSTKLAHEPQDRCPAPIGSRESCPSGDAQGGICGKDRLSSD